MINLPNEIIIYSLEKNSKNFLLFLGLAQGWGLVRTDVNHIFLKNNSAFIMGSKKDLTVNKTSLANFVFGLYRYFSQFIKLQGMGYKGAISKSFLVLKLGFSHRLLFKIVKDIKLSYVSRQLLLLQGRDIDSIKKIVYNLQKLRKASAYKKKGLFLKGAIIKIKQSSKKSKF